MLVRLLLVLVYALHGLPLGFLSRVGSAFGMLLYLCARAGRRVCEANVASCFPAMDADARSRLVRAHFRAQGRAVIERGILWWSSRRRIVRLVRIRDPEHLTAVRDRPVILLAPHFVALDAGGARLACEMDCAALYERQRSRTMDRVVYRGRTRFGHQLLFPRREGVRPALRALRRGHPLYYLPDQDYGRRGAVFVPFFGVPAATIPGLARLARLAGARVVPCVARMLPGGGGYEVRFYPAWRHFPTRDDEADARRMNAFIEQRVLEMPEQYNWMHKRFRTRPAGSGSPY